MPEIVETPHMRLVWRARELQEEVKQQFVPRMLSVGQWLRSQVRANISGPSPSTVGGFPGWLTGALRDSIYVTVAVNGDDVVLQVGTALAYGLYLELGTNGGKVIEAAPGKVFSWVDPLTQERIFAKRITLGAISPRPFISRTLRESQRELQSRLAATLPLQYGRVASSAGSA